MRSLIKALSTLTTEASRDLEKQQSEGTLDRLKIRLATWCAENPDTRIVLVIDQFEELHTMTRSDADREDVLDLVAALLAAHPDQIRLILTLRTDFEPQFIDSPLHARWDAGRFIIPPMTREDLRDIIEKPARAQVLYFDPGTLVEKLLDEVTATPGALPLLSFTLSEMYIRYVNRQSTDRALTMEDYEELGGVIGALRHRAEEEYEALDPFQQNTMRKVILRMVRIDGGSITRQRILDSDLVFPSSRENRRTQEVIERMIDARLLVRGTNDEGEGYVEPAHDALVRAWKMLREWIKQENTRMVNLRFQQNLAESARQWEETVEKDLKKGLLWRDAARVEVLKQLIKLEKQDTPTLDLPLFKKLLVQLEQYGELKRVGTKLADLQTRKKPNTSSWMNQRELNFVQESIRRSQVVRLGIIGLFSAIFMALVVILALTASRNATFQTRMDCLTTDKESLSAMASKKSSDDVFIDVLTRSRFITQDTALAYFAQPAELDTLSPGWSTIVGIDVDQYGAGQSRIEEERTLPLVIARTYGEQRGRILAAGHEDLLAYDRDDRFMDLVFSWLAGTRNRRVAISSGHLETFFLFNPEGNTSLANRLKAWDYSVEYVGDLTSLADSIATAQPAVLVIPNAWDPFTEEERETVESFVARGGGLFTAGRGWSWQFYGPEPGDEQNEVLYPLDAYPMNQLMEPFGIRWNERYVVDP